MWLRLIAVFALLLCTAALPAFAKELAEPQIPSLNGESPDKAEPEQSKAATPPKRRLFRIAPGAQFRDCAICPEMVVLPRGKFIMGSPPNELGRSPDESPQHEVMFSSLFAIGLYEITFEQWDACVAAHACRHLPDDAHWGRGRRPVINVNWNDAQEFVRWLRDKTGEDYRLPTEAEWEYAARAGTQTPRFWNEGEIACAFANVYDASGQRVHRFEWTHFNCIDAQQSTAPVGVFLPNNFGLYDMLGNVWEWTADCWVSNYDGAPADGAARDESDDGTDCSRHVMRGGSWHNVEWATRAGFRGWLPTSDGNNNVGFRVARFSR